MVYITSCGNKVVTESVFVTFCDGMGIINMRCGRAQRIQWVRDFGVGMPPIGPMRFQRRPRRKSGVDMRRLPGAWMERMARRVVAVSMRSLSPSMWAVPG